MPSLPDAALPSLESLDYWMRAQRRPSRRAQAYTGACYAGCSSCDGPNFEDCSACLDGSEPVDEDGDGFGHCGDAYAYHDGYGYAYEDYGYAHSEPSTWAGDWTDPTFRLVIGQQVRTAEGGNALAVTMRVSRDSSSNMLAVQTALYTFGCTDFKLASRVYLRVVGVLLVK